VETAPVTSLPPALREVLAATVPQLHAHCRDAWTVIGSAAVALAGASVEVADLDLLTSESDAERLIAQWGVQQDRTYQPAASDRFRSRFARFLFPGMPVEVMGGLELHTAQGWQRVRIRDVTQIIHAGVEVPIPSPTEQIRILESFGRPKDTQRAALLRAL
jgi:hypothetical protein